MGPMESSNPVQYPMDLILFRMLRVQILFRGPLDSLDPSSASVKRPVESDAMTCPRTVVYPITFAAAVGFEDGEVAFAAVASVEKQWVGVQRGGGTEVLEWQHKQSILITFIPCL